MTVKQTGYETAVIETIIDFRKALREHLVAIPAWLDNGQTDWSNEQAYLSARMEFAPLTEALGWRARIRALIGDPQFAVLPRETRRILSVLSDTFDAICAPPHNLWSFSAGGWYVFHSIGLLKAAEELGLGIHADDEVIGVSSGALLAAQVKNGMKWDEIMSIWLNLRSIRWDPRIYGRVLRPIRRPGIILRGGFMSMEGLIRPMVEEMDLQPQPGLITVSCNRRTKAPVVTRYRDCFVDPRYPLWFWLAASGAVPFLSQAQECEWNGENLELIDGGAHHFSPVDYFVGSGGINRPAIVSTYREMTHLPAEYQVPADLFLAVLELVIHKFHNNRYVDASQHIVVESGFDNVSALSPALSDATCWAMVQDTYRRGLITLSRAIDEGRVVVREQGGVTSKAS